MIKREASNKLKKYLNNKELHRNVVLVEGARQVGKTTLVKMTLEEMGLACLELNLEKKPVVRARIDACKDFPEFEQYLADEFHFHPGSGCALFIDEAQESETLGNYVRCLKEDWENTTTIISGSALTRLFREEQRYPIGRVSKLHLQPFSFVEFLRALGNDSLVSFILDYSLGSEISQNRHELLLDLLNQYITVGGLPEVVTLYSREQKSREWYELRETLIYSYRDDFIRYFGIEKANLFERAVDVVAANVGSPSKDSHIAKPGTAAYKAAADVYAQLEGWKIIHKVPQKGAHPEKTQFLPKRYLFDLGVLNYFRFRAIPSVKVDFVQPASVRTSIGGVLENYLLLQVLQESPHIARFKKRQGGTEIDFVLDLHGVKVPVECKGAVKSKLTHARGLIEYKKTYQTKDAILFNLAPPTILSTADCLIQTLPLYLAPVVHHLATVDSSE